MQPKTITITSISVFSIIVLLPIIVMFGGISMEGYKTLFMDSRQFDLLQNSLLLALGASILSVVVGVPLGYLIARTDIYGKKHLKYLYLAPLLIPPYISAIAWISLFGQNGAINQFIMSLFSLKEPVFTIYGMGGALLVLTLSYFPLITLLTISGLYSMDRKLEDAARLTRTEFGIIKSITLPLMMPYIISGAIFVFIFSLSNYGVPSLLRINTYPIEIFAQFSAYYDEGAAMALAIPIVLVSIILILLQRKYMGNRSYVALENGAEKGRAIRLGKARGIISLYPALILALSVLIPLLVLAANAGSLKTYIAALKTAHMQILVSFVLAVAAATAMVILGLFMAVIIERTHVKGKALIDILTFLPFAIPAVVIGIGLIKVWNRPVIDAVYGSALIIIFGYVTRFIPFVIRAISANMKQVNRNLEEAALLNDVGWLRRLFGVSVPLLAPGILAGWAIAYIFCMGELGTTLLVIPPGEATLPIRIYTLMHYGANQLVSALCIISIIVTLIPIVIGRLLMRRFAWAIS